MMPIGPLMIEHRLIERMIKTMQEELQTIEKNKEIVDTLFIDTVVDFIHTYADHCHHGKEEDILFRELKKKSISAEHHRIMEELEDDHRRGRKITGKLADSNLSCSAGEQNSISVIIECLRDLVDFYPKHIEKEDKHFFIPIMNYFSKDEKDLMLQEGFEFDRKLIHEKYETITQQAETRVKN
jgi:hemerythrin-like domain-containing protein